MTVLKKERDTLQAKVAQLQEDPVFETVELWLVEVVKLLKAQVIFGNKNKFKNDSNSGTIKGERLLKILNGLTKEDNEMRQFKTALYDGITDEYATHFDKVTQARKKTRRCKIESFWTMLECELSMRQAKILNASKCL